MHIICLRSSRRVRHLAAFACIGLSLLLRAAGAQQATDASDRIAALQARLSVVDPRVQYLKDRQDILDTAQRYTRGADRHDKALVRSAFWPEAMVSYGTPMGRDEFVDSEESRLAGFAAHQHHITGQTVEFDGDTAHVESYLIYFLVPRDRSADVAGTATPGRALLSEKTQLGSGRYVERWERRDGEWKILVREYIEDLSLLGETVDVCASGCAGTWDGNDLSYLRPLEIQTPAQRNARAAGNSPPRHPQGDSP